tara:strand:+ start:424 stop:984 length:561 start_codon:yes stop_codon:yes gene_type:complete
MELYNFFPTYVWADTIDIDNRMLEKEIYDFSLNTPEQIFSNVGGYQGDLFGNQEWVDKVVEKVPTLNEKPISNVTLYTWANINRKGNYNRRHVHMDTSIFLSGVYYVKVPDNSGNIRFFDPRGPLMGSMRDHDYFFGGHEHHFITPKEGLLLFFPSWLEHDVETNASDEDRISIAFNVFADINNDK